MQNVLSTGTALKRWKTWSKQGCLYCWPTAEWTVPLTVMSFLWLVGAHDVRETDRANTSQAFTEKLCIPDALLFSLKFSTGGSIITLLLILCKPDICVPLWDLQALSEAPLSTGLGPNDAALNAPSHWSLQLCSHSGMDSSSFFSPQRSSSHKGDTMWYYTTRLITALELLVESALGWELPGGPWPQGPGLGFLVA